METSQLVAAETVSFTIPRLKESTTYTICVSAMIRDREGSPTLLTAKTCEYRTAGGGQEHLHISAGGCPFLGAVMGGEGGRRAILPGRHLISSQVPPASMPEKIHWSFLITEKFWDFACLPLPIITVRCYFVTHYLGITSLVTIP